MVAWSGPFRRASFLRQSVEAWAIKWHRERSDMFFTKAGFVIAWLLFIPSAIGYATVLGFMWTGNADLAAIECLLGELGACDIAREQLEARRRRLLRMYA